MAIKYVHFMSYAEKNIETCKMHLKHYSRRQLSTNYEIVSGRNSCNQFTFIYLG